jgi:cobalt-zinc-cadmium efflux system outer membrane protein
LRPQVGVTINVPIYRGRLNAAVREATFKLNQQRAEYEQRRSDIQYEVASAYEEVEETRQTLQLYADKLVPATEQNVAAARTNYDVNKLSFLELATAQRQLIELREAREESLATYHSRLAALARAVGGTIPSATGRSE